MTKLEILDETIEYYRTHQRAKDSDGLCVYKNPKTGEMCAVGRCLIQPDCHEIRTAGDLINALGDDIFKPDYRGHSTYFWFDLQQLHDYPSHWMANGQGGHDLTEEGMEYVKELKEKYGQLG